MSCWFSSAEIEQLNFRFKFYIIFQYTFVKWCYQGQNKIGPTSKVPMIRSIFLVRNIVLVIIHCPVYMYLIITGQVKNNIFNF